MSRIASLQTLLEPASIVIVGASDDTSKPGGKLLRNILQRGYEGQLWLVHPKASEVQGICAYPSVDALPDSPDLAFIAIPAQFVRQELCNLAGKRCAGGGGAERGIWRGERGGQGGRASACENRRRASDPADWSQLLRDCVACACKQVQWAAPKSRKGGIDFLSGSGATVDFLYELATSRGLEFNSLLNVGNSAQTGVTDLLRLYEEDQSEESSLIKLLYIEVLTRPGQFLRHARNLSLKGCVLAGIKSGSTEAGTRAAASHTGAMATNDVAVQALFDKAGIIRVTSRPDLVDVATVLTCIGDRLSGRRVAVVSDAGGPAVVLSDELNRLGFSVPAFSDRTRDRIAHALPPGAASGNPVDCLPTRNGESIGNVLGIIAEEESDNVDYILFIDGDSGLADNWEICRALMHAQDTGGIPVLPCFLSPVSAEDALSRFREAGRCYFEDEVCMARALARVVNRPVVSNPAAAAERNSREQIAALLAGRTGVLSHDVTQQVLNAVGIRLPEQALISERDALETVQTPYPWVMKVVGPLHKSDVGGVRMGIESLSEAHAAWDQLLSIPGASGCLVQRMVSGPEVIVGANREDGYGHLIAFGLGGIYTEVLKDMQFRLAPLSAVEAEQMIRTIRAFSLLSGVRGQPGMDIDVLIDMLIRTSLLVSDFPSIRELDLNPVKGSGTELYAVDARIIID